MAREKLNDANVYDPDVVYTGRSTDSHGHSTNIRSHIPDPWVAIVSEFVHSADWPEYMSPQAFYRDAIYHRMKWASMHSDRWTSARVKALIAIAEGEAALDYADLMRESSKLYVEKARKTLSDLHGDNNQAAVKMTLASIEAGLPYIEEPWKSELTRLVDDAERRMVGL